MDLVTDTFSFAMHELGPYLKSLGAADSSIYCHLTDFKDGFEFLSLFVDCIRNWSNALEVAPHLGSLAAKIEATLQKIVGEFIEEVKVYKVDYDFKLAFSNSKLISFFEQWNPKIDALRPEIGEACDNSMSVITNNSIKCNSPSLNFCKWQKFAKSNIFYVSDQIPNIRNAIRIRWNEGPSFFEILGNYYLENPRIAAFLIKVGCLIISAAMLICHWRAKNFDPNIKLDVDAAIRDLGWKLGMTNPELIDIILKEQKSGASCHIADIIVYRLIPYSIPSSERGYIRWVRKSLILSKLRNELYYLLTTVLNISKEDALLQIFLPDIKQLILEIASLHHSLLVEEDMSVFKDLLLKVCLSNVEISLRKQLVADTFYSLGGRNDALNEFVSVMEESHEGSDSNKFTEQILIMVKEVATDVDRYRASVSLKMVTPLDEGVIDKKTLILRLLLKTLLIKGEILFLKLRDKLLDSFKGPLETLHTWFKIIIPLVLRDEKKLKFSDVEMVASKIILLYHRILDQDISESEEMFQSMKGSISDLVDEINAVMKEFKEIYLGKMYARVRNSDFPKTNAVGFIDSLLKKLQDLVSYGMYLVESVINKGQMLEIMGHLEFFQTFLGSDISLEDSKPGLARLINICYEAEYFFDSAIQGKEDKWHNVIWLYHLIKEIREIKIKVSSTKSMITKKS